MAASTESPNVYLWRTDLNDVIADFCARDFRDLTAEQREQYGISDNDNSCDLWEVEQE